MLLSKGDRVMYCNDGTCPGNRGMNGQLGTVISEEIWYSTGYYRCDVKFDNGKHYDSCLVDNVQLIAGQEIEVGDYL